MYVSILYVLHEVTGGHFMFLTQAVGYMDTICLSTDVDACCFDASPLPKCVAGVS